MGRLETHSKTGTALPPVTALFPDIAPGVDQAACIHAGQHHLPVASGGNAGEVALLQPLGELARSAVDALKRRRAGGRISHRLRHFA